jgi:hypothetical protein
MVSICQHVMPTTAQVNPLSAFLQPEGDNRPAQQPPLAAAVRENYVL